MVTDATKIYRPINGTEAIDLACHELRKAMENSGLFPLNRVFHEFELKGAVKVTGYSTNPAGAQFTTRREGTGGEFNEDRVNISIEPAPPSLLRERLDEKDAPEKAPEPDIVEVAEVTFPCRTCDRIFESETGRRTHEKRFCKGLHSVTEIVDNLDKEES
jgi:hypothetical protein